MALVATMLEQCVARTDRVTTAKPLSYWLPVGRARILTSTTMESAKVGIAAKKVLHKWYKASNYRTSVCPADKRVCLIIAECI